MKYLTSPLLPPAELPGAHFPSIWLQPKLRQVFESVFDCSTASGNNQVGAAATRGREGVRAASCRNGRCPSPRHVRGA